MKAGFIIEKVLLFKIRLRKSMFNFPTLSLTTEKENRINENLVENADQNSNHEDIMRSLEIINNEPNIENWTIFREKIYDHEYCKSFTKNDILQILELANKNLFEEELDISSIKIEVIYLIIITLPSSIDYLIISESFQQLFEKISKIAFTLEFWQSQHNINIMINVNELIKSLVISFKPQEYPDEIAAVFLEIQNNLIDLIASPSCDKIKHYFLSTLKEMIKITTDYLPIFELFANQIQLTSSYSSNQVSFEAISEILNEHSDIYELIAPNEDFLQLLFQFIDIEYGCSKIALKILNPFLSNETILEYALENKIHQVLLEQYNQNINNSLFPYYLNTIIMLCDLSPDCCQFYLEKIFPDNIPQSFSSQVELVKIIHSALKYQLEIPNEVVQICVTALDSDQTDILLPLMEIIIAFLDQGVVLCEDLFEKLQEIEDNDIDSQELYDLVQLILSRKT